MRFGRQFSYYKTSGLGTEDIAVTIRAKYLCVSFQGIKEDTSATVTY